MRNRLVPEDRIKKLTTIVKFDIDHISESAHNDIMIEAAGLELARKLFQFRKQLIVRNGDRQTLTLEIEIIVPKGPPDALSEQSPIQRLREASSSRGRKIG